MVASQKRGRSRGNKYAGLLRYGRHDRGAHLLGELSRESVKMTDKSELETGRTYRIRIAK